MQPFKTDQQLTGIRLYFGDYTELYNTLLPDQIFHLERAIQARRIGQFQDAYDIFDNLLPPSHSLPLLTIERWLLYQRQGLDSASSDLIKKTLSNAASWQHKVQGNETILLEILLAEAESRGYGKLREAVAQARITRDLLKDISIDSYTDVEIGCVRAYFAIMVRCQRQSNWLNKTIDPFFPSTAARIPWQGIEAVREIAWGKGKFHISHWLLRLEEDFINQETYFARTKDFIQRCQVSEHAAVESVTLLIILAKLYYAESLINAAKPQQAEEPLDWVSQRISAGFLLDRGSAKGVYYVRFYKLLKHLQSPLPTRQERVAQLMETAAESENDRDLLMEISVLNEILGIFTHVQQREWSPVLRNLYGKCQECFLHITSHENIGALFEHAAISRFLAAADDDTEKEELLGAVAAFEAKYPDYFIPTMGEMCNRSSARLAWQQEDREEAFRYEEKLRLAIINCPYGEAAEDGSWRFNAAGRSDPSNFIRAYRIGDSSQWITPLLTFVLDWLKDEVEIGLLSAQEASQLLCLSDLFGGDNEVFNDSLKLKTFIETLDPGKAALNLFGSPKPVSVDVWTKRFGRLESWLKLTDRPPAAEVRQTILGDLQNARVSLVQHYHQSQMSLDLEKHFESGRFDHKMRLEVTMQHKLEANRHLAILKTLHSKAIDATGDGLLAVEWNSISQIASSATIEAFRAGMVTDIELCRGQQWMEEALARQRAASNHPTVLIMNTMSSIATFRWLRYVMFGTQKPQDRLQILRELDKFYVSLRRQKSVLRGWRLFNSRTQFTEGITHMNHRQFAIGTILEICGAAQLRDDFHGVYKPPKLIPLDGEYHGFFVELVDWTQKLKAQSVLECLGSEIILPASILSRLSPESAGAQLLIRESELQQKASHSLANQIETRRELDNLRAAMKLEPSLDLIINMREGASIDAAQIKVLSQDLGPDVVILDWLYLPIGCTGNSSELLPMIYRGGKLVRAVFEAKVTYNDVRAWVENYMDETQHPYMFSEQGNYESETPDDILHFMDSLIAPLQWFCKPGELVVLSPTNALHRVPLHALHINGQPLIERNPVVYTQSISMLRMCKTLAETRDTSQDFKAVIIEALGPSDLVRPNMNFADDIIETIIFKNDLLSKEVFLEVVPDADLLHFHGHVFFEENSPLDHFMDIKDEERVTARDIFNLKLNHGSHVTLIGCSSGRARISAHDDLLGLSTAFHYAGASSIMSTLWDIDRNDGADFEEAFYRALRDQQNSSPSIELVNLATAMQSTILELRKDKTGLPGSTRSPYHWAGFVFHGYWKFPCLPARLLPCEENICRLVSSCSNQ